MLYICITIDSKYKFTIKFLSIFNNAAILLECIGNDSIPESMRNQIAHQAIRHRKHLMYFLKSTPLLYLLTDNNSL